MKIIKIVLAFAATTFVITSVVSCASLPESSLAAYERNMQAKSDQLVGRVYSKLRFNLYKNQLMNSGRRIMVAPVYYDAEFEGKTSEAVGYGGGYQDRPLWWRDDRPSGDLTTMADRIMQSLLQKLDQNPRFEGVDTTEVSHFVELPDSGLKRASSLFPRVASDTTSQYRKLAGGTKGLPFMAPEKLQRVAAKVRDYADSVLFVGVHALWRKADPALKKQGVYARKSVIDDETVIQYQVSFQLQIKLCSATECSSAALPTTVLKQVVTDIPLPLEDFDDKTMATRISDFAARYHTRTIVDLVNKTMNYLAFGRV